MLLALVWLGSGCDNPACVYGPDGCGAGANGGLLAAPATVPANHQWIESGAPTIAARIPASNATPLHPDSPVALVFSESMSSSSLTNSVRLQEVGSGGFGAPVAIASVLVSEGRVLVVLPTQALSLGVTYELVWNDNAVPVDLQGQALVIPEGRIAGTFSVAATAPTTVRLLGTFPADLALNQSGVGEFLALFDRRLNPGTITPTSFDIKVAGLNPTFDPLPTALSITVAGNSVSDTRGYRWRSLDGSGEPSPLGAGLQFDCSLSPVGHKISATDATQLVPIHSRFTVAAISPPLSAAIVSMPTDAFGIDNLSGLATLDIQIDLAAAQTGDRLGIFLFGNSVGTSPQRVALLREVPLTGPALVLHIGEAEIDLLSDQGLGRLADGNIDLAFRLQRGTATTPVRLLDADLLISGVQSTLLDLTRPVLSGLGSTGNSTTVFRSDLSDFALVGRATERIRSVEVSTTLGNNGVLTPVVGSSTSGLFVAAPVLLGTLTAAQRPLPFTAQIYDNALNSALVSIAGDFTQFGASGPGAPLPGPSITVEVFNSATLAPLGGALVMIHEDLGGGSILPIDSGLTGPDGKVTLTAGFVGETFVTVDMLNFDLFTFEDVPTDRLSVPLTPQSTPPATVAGFASSKSSTFSTFSRFVVDSRRFGEFEPLINVLTCAQNGQTQSFDCAFGPSPIQANRLGVASMFAVEPPPTELNYNSATFLRAFQIGIPVASVGGGSVSSVSLSATTLLSDSTVALEERAIDGPALILDLNSTAGLALGMLSGAPRVLVEARVRGVPGSAAVGLGVAFDMGSNSWRVRSAYPGAVDGIQETPQDALGRLVQSGALDPDLFLSCEVRDSFGGRAGRRPRLSQLGATLEPVSVPLILSPLPGGSTGGPSFNLTFANAIPNSAGTPGMYRATLTAGAPGRRWQLWRQDLGDVSGPTRTIVVPDLTSLGGTALPNGVLSARVECFGYGGFSAADFQWSDIEREYDTFSASPPMVFSQP